jgi:FO synthase
MLHKNICAIEVLVSESILAIKTSYFAAFCRELQRTTGGLTEFVPLPFVHMEAPIFRKGCSRAGPTLREALLMHAVARLVLCPWVLNIQASWVKMGPHWAGELLRVGCNDMGGSIMNESITRCVLIFQCPN